MEWKASMALDYNLYIDNQEWHRWMMYLARCHVAVQLSELLETHLRREHIAVAHTINQILDACEEQSEMADPYYLSRSASYDTMAEQSLPTADRTGFEAINEHPVYPRTPRPSKILHRNRRPPMEACPSPAPWCPEADPIIPKPPRATLTAPGADSLVNNIFEWRNSSIPRAWDCIVDMCAGGSMKRIERRAR
jgi:hypothetical protein